MTSTASRSSEWAISSACSTADGVSTIAHTRVCSGAPAATRSAATVRTSALSTPIPNAFVATTTSALPSMNASWLARRASGLMPAW